MKRIFVVDKKGFVLIVMPKNEPTNFSKRITHEMIRKDIEFLRSQSKR